MFSSLSIRNFRLYWFGMLVSLVGSWIQAVAQSWLVFDLTRSEFLLGLVGFLGSLPVFVFSLFAGVFADRINKKHILLITQNAFMVLAFALALLIQFKMVTVNQIMLIALLNGIVMAFDSPTRQSIVVELVGKQHLLNAIALNSAAFNSARLIGPALAGILVAAVGMSGCFYVNGISFVAVIIALLLIKNNHLPKKNNGVFLKDLNQGIRFIVDNRVILILISIVGMASLFGISYAILMPVFADKVLHAGVKGLGILMSSSGLGALLSALLLARFGMNLKQRGGLIVFSSIVFSLGLILFSQSKVFLFSCIYLMVIGWSSVTAMTLVNNSLQILVPDEFRGRVMSAFMFTFAGVMPFGNLIAGTLAHAWGAPFAVGFSGFACLAFFLYVWKFFPQLKKI